MLALFPPRCAPQALGGRIVPLRSADLLIAVEGSSSTVERQKAQKVASEDWLKSLAETHIWQEPY
jgi:hypothetical protein